MSSVQSAMSFLRRRFSDNNVVTGNTNDGLMDGDNPAPNSPATAPENNAPPAQIVPPRRGRTETAPAGGGFFASLTSGNPLAALKSDPGEVNKILLVIDDQHTNWARYFKGKKICGDLNIRVEQAEFSELSVSSSSVDGVTVDINAIRNGSRVIRSFTPHFLLVRQAAKSMGEEKDFGNLIIGFKHGGVPAVNSLHSQYNFMDKPWTFAQLIRIQKKLGKEKFPLVHQIYYPSAKQMLTSSVFPVVIKIGHAHRGMAKFKVHDHYEFQDVVGVAAMANTYVVVEQFVDTLYDLRIQKIGGDYKAYKRVSVSKNWKSNRGSAMLEEIAINERHKLWVDACSDMFGGLDIVGVKVLHGKDGKDYITEVTDCSMMLIGERQEEDRRIIVDLVMQRMQACIRPTKKISREEMTNTAPSPVHMKNAPNKPEQQHHQQQQQQKTINVPRTAPPMPLQMSQQHADGSKPSATATTHQSAPVSPSAIEAHSRKQIGELNQGGEVKEMRRGFSSATVSDDESKAEKIRSLRQSFVNLFE